MVLSRLLHSALAVWAISLCFPASAIVTPSSTAEQSTSLAALGDAFYSEQVRFDPVNNGTLSGDNRFDDQLNISISPAQRRQHFAKLHQLQQRLQAIPRIQLSDEDALTYDVLAAELRLNLGGETFPDHLLPLSQLDSMPVQLANFGSGQAEQPLNTVKDYQNYLTRIARLPQWIDQSINNMRVGMQRGIVLPRHIVNAMLPPLKELTKALDNNPFYTPAKNFPASFSTADKEKLRQHYSQVIQQQVIPATKRLAAFVENKYLPASRATDGIGALPNGAQWYQQCMRLQTTMDLDPEKIHALGLQEVARIQMELKNLAPKLGYSGDSTQMLTWVRTNPKFLPFKTEAEILDAYRAINEKVKPQLPHLFGHLPKTALDIRAEPELTRAVASDHYSLPSDDGSRPGVFWAVINNPADYNMATMASLFLHEGQPGHHFQLSIQQEAKIPQFRKRALINAYAEGWALYAESLGKEMGLYDDPVMYASNLRLDMVRAVRLVVDTGIHTKGWTHDQAIQYMSLNTGYSESDARNQIERYMAWPGQALGYKLGALKILELRERAKQQLGDKFSLPAFHDAILLEGPLPLSVLDQRINRWVKLQ